jgi:hypothetical protein
MLHYFHSVYDAIVRLLSNERLYLIYFWTLVAGSVLLAILRWLGVVTDRLQLAPGLTAQITRGAESTNILSAAYVTIVTVLNLGLAQLVFPLLPSQINRFAFAMVVIETAAWAYLIYRWPWFSNWLIGLRF